MTINHLNYCAKEIVLIRELIKIENCDFYNRSIARYIAVRLDDFIKIGFRLNKSTLNLKLIKDELNDLAQFYAEYLKTSRDKFGAHFQHLDYFDRLSNWADINLETVVFFANQVEKIYLFFQSLSGFIPLHTIVIDESSRDLIKIVNNQHDIEKQPNLSSDILAFTRNNSGGLVHQNGLQTKGGVLKALELLIGYTESMLKQLNVVPIRHIFIKIFILDIVSYADNLISRPEITPTDKQYDPGLDYYLTQIEFPAESELLSRFLASYRFQEKIDEIRIIRNKTAGHLDTSYDIATSQELVNNVDLISLGEFYKVLKQTFAKICSSTTALSIFRLDTSNTLSNVISISGLDSPTFNGQPASEYTPNPSLLNDIKYYYSHWEDYMKDGNEKSSSFFLDSFFYSEILKVLEVEEVLNEGGSRFYHYDYRLGHQFFDDMLKANVPEKEKIAIANLFILASRGYSGILAHFLLNSLPNAGSELKFYYLRAISHLDSYPPLTILPQFQELFDNSNLWGKCELIKSVFRISINKRLNNHTTPQWTDDLFSELLYDLISKESNFYNRFCLSISLLSELQFNTSVYPKNNAELYFNFFHEHISQCYPKILKRKDGKSDLIDYEKHIVILKANRILTFLALASDSLFENGHEDRSAELLDLFYNGTILAGNQTDKQELFNLTYLLYKCGHLFEAINTAEKILRINVTDIESHIHLLNYYLLDEAYREKFEHERINLIQNYNLDEETREKIEDMSYE
ncbi:hypothetical protein [Sphingobacterium sp. MYb388]|uniref:hypothetical protein n=1 Tax=Sphingobacterium sp. MYb388 TaxID=2745437 RepID=UPI00309B4912